MKKTDSYYHIIIFSFVVVVFLALMDILGARMFAKVGGWSGSVYTTVFNDYMLMFWGFAFAIFASIAIVYYILRRDKSESLGIFLSGAILVVTGWEDIFFYVLQGKWLDAVMPWLDANIIMHTVANTMGYASVTMESLMVTAFLGLVAVFLTSIFLKKFV